MLTIDKNSTEDNYKEFLGLNAINSTYSGEVTQINEFLDLLIEINSKLLEENQEKSFEFMEKIKIFLSKTLIIYLDSRHAEDYLRQNSDYSSEKLDLDKDSFLYKFLNIFQYDKNILL
jgi:hypothetical protein